jgi:hypothetical protein
MGVLSTAQYWLICVSFFFGELCDLEERSQAEKDGDAPIRLSVLSPPGQ